VVDIIPYEQCVPEPLSLAQIIELYNSFIVRCNLEQAESLEKAFMTFCSLLVIDCNFEVVNLTNKNNFKGHKGEHTPDFLIYCYNGKMLELELAVELKNYDYSRGYTTSITNAEEQILSRFSNYARFKKMLIITNPGWGRGAKEYLVDKGVNIIELNYLVTEENWIDACIKIEAEVSKIFPQLNWRLSP
jgi:hypothetical protein